MLTHVAGHEDEEEVVPGLVAARTTLDNDFVDSRFLEVFLPQSLHFFLVDHGFQGRDRGPVPA